MKNTSWVNNLGVVMKSDSGFFVLLGSPKDKFNPLTVELTVKDKDGKIVAQTTNPLLNLGDPRTRAGITEEQLSKIPDKIKFNISLPPHREN